MFGFKEIVNRTDEFIQRLYEVLRCMTPKQQNMLMEKLEKIIEESEK